MKKFLLLSVFALTVFAAHAQFGKPIKMPLAVGDTAVNTTAAAKIITTTAGYNAIGIQPVVTKVSGTVAGKAYLLWSLDGTNYIKTDSITLTNVTTNTAVWAKQTTPAGYYKVQVVGTDTMAAILSVWYTIRKNISQ